MDILQALAQISLYAKESSGMSGLCAAVSPGLNIGSELHAIIL